MIVKKDQPIIPPSFICPNCKQYAKPLEVREIVSFNYADGFVDPQFDEWIQFMCNHCGLFLKDISGNYIETYEMLLAWILDHKE